MKSALRKQFKSKISSISSESKAIQSSKICDLVTKHPFWKQSKSICIFLSVGSEVNTSQILNFAFQDSKSVYIPKVISETEMIMIPLNSLTILSSWPKSEPFNIIEPPKSYIDTISNSNISPPKLLDLLIMPGLGFDHFGGRLGKGRGYYDRYISKFMTSSSYSSSPKLLAIAFDEQLLTLNSKEMIPMESTDIKMNSIITPSIQLNFT